MEVELTEDQDVKLLRPFEQKVTYIEETTFDSSGRFLSHRTTKLSGVPYIRQLHLTVKDKSLWDTQAVYPTATFLLESIPKQQLLIFQYLFSV